MRSPITVVYIVTYAVTYYSHLYSHLTWLLSDIWFDSIYPLCLFLQALIGLSPLSYHLETLIVFTNSGVRLD